MEWLVALFFEGDSQSVNEAANTAGDFIGTRLAEQGKFRTKLSFSLKSASCA